MFSINNAAINVSVIEIDGHERFDLINGKTELTKTLKPNCIPTQSFEQFTMLIGNSVKNRKQQVTDQNAISRSHYLVIFTTD